MVRQRLWNEICCFCVILMLREQKDASIGEDHTPETHIVPIILQVALGQRAELSIFGDDYDTPDGTCIRDYVYIEDLIKRHILALEYLKNGGESDVFNLGSNNGYSVKEMLDVAREVTGQEIPRQSRHAEQGS